MTREEAIKLIDTHTVCFYNEIDSPTLQALHLAIEALQADAVHESCEDCPLYDKERHNCPRFNKVIPRTIAETVQGWIPCGERLPKEKQEVYVTVYFIEGDTGRAYGYMDGFGKWHLCSTVEGTLNSGYEVLAWMPLPKPYREDGE